MGDRPTSAGAAPRGLVRHLPNAISGLRIALVPVWLGLALGCADPPVPLDRRLTLAVIFAVMGASDLLDGFLARRLHLASNFGATLDAVADKLTQVVTVTLLSLAPVPATAALPRALLVALIARDALLGVGWLVVRVRRGRVDTTHRWHGRALSLLLFALVFGALLGLPAAVVSPLGLAIAVLVGPSTLAYLADGVRQLGGRASST